MQVWIFEPGVDFQDSVIRSLRKLDSRRLGAALNECKTLLQTVTGLTVNDRGRVVIWSGKRARRNAPIAKAWEGYAHHLAWYGHLAYIELCRRYRLRTGENPPVGYWSGAGLFFIRIMLHIPAGDPPPFVRLGSPIFREQRAKLLHKAPEFYGRYRWNVAPSNDFLWNQFAA